MGLFLACRRGHLPLLREGNFPWTSHLLPKGPPRLISFGKRSNIFREASNEEHHLSNEEFSEQNGHGDVADEESEAFLVLDVNENSSTQAQRSCAHYFKEGEHPLNAA